MSKFVGFIYGVLSYVVFLASFLYAIGFVGNWIVPKSIDSQPLAGTTESLIIDALLLGAFAIQHSVMARPWFKAAWTRVVSPSVERSTYVLISSLLLLLLFWQWRPVTQVAWDVSDGPWQIALVGLCWIGWLTVLLSTFMVGHFDLFGLRQVFLNLRGEKYRLPEFTLRGLYAVVRHPIMLGFIIAFWAAPLMTVGHLVFAVATSGYILLGIQFEEHDLVNELGDAYRAYRKKVPMLFPWPKTPGGES